MLFEQAFFALPEILHGSGYQKQDYEAGIIGAFTLAVLQVLNGRNVNNPIGCIQAEKLFRSGGAFQGVATPRYFRSDLFLDVSKLYVANRRLSQYGWRHNLWLEGKFLRGQAGDGNTHCSNKTNYVAGVLADLIRLAVLIPEEESQTKAARYFLHVYDAEPEYYLTFHSRPWCKRICEPGTHSLVLENLGRENPSIISLLGNLGDLKVELNVTNLSAWPVCMSNKPIYWCCLTRINSVKATLGQDSFEITIDRDVTEATPGNINTIAGHVANTLHIKPDSAEAQPAVEEELSDGDNGRNEEQGA
jgi:hypothetical protein